MPLILHDKVFVISDVHAGDPANQRLDDFCLDAPFARLLDELVPREAGGPATLVIAGDFIDFAQTLPDRAKHDQGDGFGVTSQDSLDRLHAVMSGHVRVFDAIERYLIKNEGQILILPGNHDIDFHWESVFETLRRRVGGVDAPQFAFVRDGSIQERGLYIEHGNQYSFENRFEHWKSPILRDSRGTERIERPWGTLFMDLVYSDLKELYPFINKFWPHGDLAQIAVRSYWDDHRIPLTVIARLLAFLVAKGRRFVWERLLGTEPRPAGARLDQVLDELRIPAGARRNALHDECQGFLGWDVTAGLLGADRKSGDRNTDGLLGRTDERGLTEQAHSILRSQAAQFVVFGHTHESIDGNVSPPWGDMDPRRYFNTGSWVPKIDIGGDPSLHVRDLVRFAQDSKRLALSPRILAVDLPRRSARLLPVPQSW